MKVGLTTAREQAAGVQNVLANAFGFIKGLSDTVEMLMFPYLFPQGTGYFRGGQSIHDYVKYRAKQAFSLFTLLPQYILTLFHLRQATLFRNQTSMCLDKQYQTLKRKHPHASEEEIIKQLLKWNVPPAIAGSPSYFRDQLKSLLAMVERYGLPTFFVTLTADESSNLRWEEIKDLESIISKMCGEPVDWSRMPAENARLFVHRVQTLFDTQLKGTSGILGNIGQHVIRYELQGRGSLHAHILLWVSQEDVHRVTNELVAAIPGIWNESSQEYERPEDPEERLLFDYVLRKQQHRCRADGCLKDGHCKYGFPHPLHTCPQANIHPDTKMWQYYRPREPDRMTVVLFRYSGPRHCFLGAWTALPFAVGMLTPAGMCLQIFKSYMAACFGTRGLSSTGDHLGAVPNKDSFVSTIVS